MKKERYGKFRFRDYAITLIPSFFLAVLAIAELCSGMPLLWIIPLLLSVYWIWSIYKISKESFCILDDKLKIVRGNREYEMVIPAMPTIVVSYADACTQFEKEHGLGDRTYLLNGRFAISILQPAPLEEVLERLHVKHMVRYTNTTVERIFENSFFIYSFVGSQELMDRLLTGRQCQIIIPESLQKQALINMNEKNVYVDIGY